MMMMHQVSQVDLTFSQPREVRNRKNLLLLKVILFHLITFWSVLPVFSYEIWSVYFDDTVSLGDVTTDLTELHVKMPSISEDNQTRRQLFDLPFSQTRHIFEIATYINETSGPQIRRMELSLCEQIDLSTATQLPGGSTLINPKNGATYACLQRVATQSALGIAHQLVNTSIVRFPQDVGLPLSSSAVLLTIQYRNQDYHLLEDNSGFDLYLTDEPMPIEAGIMAVGQVPDHRFFLPPNMTEWATRATCHRSCFDSKMEQNDISITAFFPSTNHHAMEELTLHVSSPDGSKQKIFAWGGDTSVDMSEEPSFKPGEDQLEVQCSYRQSNRTLTGGMDDFNELNENCLVWLHYYPRIDLEGCFSSYSAATIMSLLDINELNAAIIQDVGFSLSIDGEKLAKFVDEKDRSGTWDRAKLLRSRYSVLNGRQVPQCGWKWNTAVPELK